MNWSPQENYPPQRGRTVKEHCEWCQGRGFVTEDRRDLWSARQRIAELEEQLAEAKSDALHYMVNANR